MFCALRQYEDCADVAELQSRVEKELLPALRDMPGFISYMVIDCDDGDVTSISLFETLEQTEEANTMVAKMVKSSLADLVPEGPTISVGEVIIDNRK
jgi:hypothetical protein